MPSQALSTRDEIDQISREMARARLDMHRDASGVVRRARALTDLIQPLRDNVWILAASAVAIGYFLIPKRNALSQSVAPSSVDVSAAHPQSETAQATPRGERGILHTATAFIWPVLFRVGQSYAINMLEGALLQNAPKPRESAESRESESRQTNHADVALNPLRESNRIRSEPQNGAHGEWPRPTDRG